MACSDDPLRQAVQTESRRSGGPSSAGSHQNPAPLAARALAVTREDACRRATLTSQRAHPLGPGLEAVTLAGSRELDARCAGALRLQGLYCISPLLRCSSDDLPSHVAPAVLLYFSFTTRLSLILLRTHDCCAAASLRSAVPQIPDFALLSRAAVSLHRRRLTPGIEAFALPKYYTCAIHHAVAVRADRARRN